jgi:serine/threonine-protein kinase
MTRPAKACDWRRLDLFLRDRLPEGSRPDLEAHLLVCPACRDKLDELAGGTRWWTDVRRYLGGDGACQFTQPPDGSDQDLATVLGLDFLEPSQHPTSLGRLGPYEVLEVLGKGGWGIVLKAFEPALHRPVAIKVLAAAYAAHGPARKRFAREAQAAAAVIHDNVISVHAVNAEATPPYFVMALIVGQSLEQRIARTGPLLLPEILRIGMQTASGLAAAHAQGLVHRDIKPANIMLENGIERVKITDFGLARAVDDASLSQSGSVAGTPQYMAPEQARGEAVDQRADLFSLGSTLYAMCTGQAPFRGDGALAVLRQVCDVEPVPIRARNPDIPAWLEGVIRKLHAKDPASRFQSAAEVAELLERCLAHVQQPTRHPLPPLADALGRQLDPHSPPRSRRPRWFAVATCAAALVVGVGVALWSQHPGQEQTHPLPRSDGDVLRLVPGDDEFLRGASEVRARLNGMEQSLASVPWGQENGPDQEIRNVRQRAEALHHNFNAAPAWNPDPLNREISILQQRLGSLERALAPNSP